MTRWTLSLILIALVGCADSRTESAESTAAGSEPDLEAIQAVIHDQINGAGGKMAVADADLTFDYLHEGIEDKEGMYVSCADFKSATGDTYDLDYYVGEGEGGELEVAKITLHEKNGTPVNEVLWTKAAD